MLAHYLNRPDFTKQVVEGDPHQYNADQVGITRPGAKTLIYAILYGAKAPKIAATLGVSVKEGGRIRNLKSEEHTSELQPLMRISYAVFCLKKKKIQLQHDTDQK